MPRASAQPQLPARPARPARPQGRVTRGTTGTNRLRRCDRWLAGPQAWRLRAPAEPPVVVDLGYGRTGWTARELRDRLARVRPDVQIVGVEIDPERVAAAQPLAGDGLSFRVGGFEAPVDAAGGLDGRPDRPVSVIRAFNVLRQYDEDEVAAAWALMRSRLTPEGIVVDGTCDELGRRASWITLDANGPVSLTCSLRLAGLERPSDVAPRLPKALIHRNVPGEAVHTALAALDRAWERAAGHAAYGVVTRWVETVRTLRADGWPVEGGPARWRLGEVTLGWDAVRPNETQRE